MALCMTLWIGLLLCAARLAGAAQTPMAASGAGPHFHSHAAGAWASRPFEDLSLLSSTGYTHLGHTSFPHYNVRIKKSDFCDGTVQ